MRGNNLKYFIFIACFKALIVLSIATEKILKDVFHLSNFTTYSTVTFIFVSLVLLLTFHKYSQCIFMITIPKMISKRGRMFVMASAFVLAFTGPTSNLMKNGEKLTESISCSQVILFFYNLAFKNYFYQFNFN